MEEQWRGGNEDGVHPQDVGAVVGVVQGKRADNELHGVGESEAVRSIEPESEISEREETHERQGESHCHHVEKQGAPQDCFGGGYPAATCDADLRTPLP